MKEAKKTQITEAICKQARLMRKGGANQTEIGLLLGVNPCTISRIEKAGFDLATYTAQRKERREKEKRQAEEPRETEELPGQMEMDLTTAEEPKEMSDQVKMMRFQAHQADRIVKAIEESAVMLNTKLDRLNDTLSMILRAVRRE